MHHARRLSLGSIGVVALALGAILSSCGATPTTEGMGAPDSTATAYARTQYATAASTAATATPSPTAPVSPGGIPVSAGCPPVSDTAIQPHYVSVGALQVSVPARLTYHDYPSALMPNDAPHAPFQLAASAVNNFAPNPPVNPSLETGFHLQICNETAAAHTLSSLSVTIARFTPSSGPVAVWHICGDGPFDAATKRTTTGCGGGIGEVVFLAATLPSDSTGASAPARANPQFLGGGMDLPASIGPNEAIRLLVAINGLTSQGTYALSFGVSVDGGAPVTIMASDGPFFIAPSPTVWTGTACQTPAMQALIPPASQDTYYVCPPTT